MHVSSDGPCAGLINEFTLPMWHRFDNQIPRQACFFPLRVFVCVCLRGQALSLFLWQGRYIPCTVCVCVCFCVCVRERQWRESKNHDSTTARSTWLKVLIPSKSLKWDLTQARTNTHSESHFACRGLITLCVVQLEYYPQCHCKTVRSANRLKVTDFIIFRSNALPLTSKLCFANVKRYSELASTSK